MRKALHLFLVILLCCSVFTGTFAEGTSEYSDRFYSFRYPASWNQGIAYDGTIILEIPGTSSGVMTFTVVSEIGNYTGDPAADAAAAESVISGFTEEKARAGGKNTALSGQYELITVGEMHGFRASGKWLATGSDIVMIQFSGDSHLVSFILIGDEAIAMEEELLSSVELKDASATGGSDGFLNWQGELFAFAYPESFVKYDYGMKNQSEVILLVNLADTNNIIMARTYPLDYDYSDDLAPILARMLLPQSTGIDAEAETVKCGPWNTAFISGTVDAGPLAFYVTGSDRTLLAVMFTGDEAVEQSPLVMASIEIY